MMQNISL